MEWPPVQRIVKKINFCRVSKLSSRCGSWYFVGKHFFWVGRGGGSVNMDNENGDNYCGDNI